MTQQTGEMKRWAKDHLKGVENTLFPSFTPDMRDLDEAGIRHDVRQSIAHGFFSMMCATETGLTLEESKRFLAIAADEAKGRILVTTSVILDSFEANLELLAHAEKVGVNGALLGYPPSFHPEDKEEVYTATRRLADATRLHLTLYPSPHFPFNKFHPSGFPLDVLDRLADLPNVVAVKVGELGLFADAHRICGDRLLVGCPVERYVPLLSQGFKMKWMGAGCYEVFQSPQKPYLVEYFRLLLEGKTAPAMELYWKLAPMRNIFEQQFNQTVMSGTYNWHAQKFYQWSVGGNGGLTRQPAMKLHSWEIDQIRMGYYTIGIEPRENEAEFWVGRGNYERAHAQPHAAAPRVEDSRVPARQSELEALCGAVERAVKDTEAEMSELPAMIRPMVTMTLTSKSGRSLDDWSTTLHACGAALKTNGASTDPRLAEDLARLAGCFEDAPKQKRGSLDEKENAAREKQMLERAAVTRAFSRALAQLAAPRG